MKNTCTSCGRKFDGEGVYCGNCLNEKGKLKSFEEVRNNLGEYIQKTQGYAEEPAGEIAESILKQQPAWEKRFDAIARKKKTEKRKKAFKKLLVIIPIMLLVSIIIFASLYYSGIITITRTIHTESTPIKIVGANKNYVVFLRYNKDKASIYKKDLLTGEVSPLSSEKDTRPYKLDTYHIISNGYFVWLDKRHVESNNDNVDIYVSDFENPERIITPSYSADWESIFLRGNWLVFSKKNLDKFIIYACDLSDIDSTPEIIVEYRGLFDFPNIELEIIDGKIYLAYIEKRHDRNSLYLLNLDTREKDLIYSHSLLYQIASFHPTNHIFYTMQIKKYDYSLKKNVIQKDTTRLMNYDVKTGVASSVAINSFDLSRYKAFDVDKYLLLYTYTEQYTNFLIDCETGVISNIFGKNEGYMLISGFVNIELSRDGYLSFMKSIKTKIVKGESQPYYLQILFFDFKKRKFLRTKLKDFYGINITMVSYKNILYLSGRDTENDYFIKRMRVW